MSSPLVSVIVPCFNYERFVAAAIESALAQDWPALEIIAVDDGSTDGTGDVLAGFGADIRVITRENGGLNAATDTGVEAARGELITFLDADDTWPAGRVRVLAQALADAPQAGLAYGDMCVVDGDGMILNPSFNQAKGLIPPPSGRFLGRLLSHNCVSAGSLMVRAELLALFHPIPPQAAWNDWWIATQVLREREIVAVPEVVNVYRWHGSNMNLGSGADGMVKLLRAELPFRRWLLSNTEPPLVGISDLLSGLATLDWALEQVAAVDGCAPALVVSAREGDAGEAFQEARGRLADGDLPGGLAKLVSAAAHAPSWDAPREILSQAVQALRQPAGPDRSDGISTAARSCR